MGVDSDNQPISANGENGNSIVEQPSPTPNPGPAPVGEIVDLTLADVTVRQRPRIDTSLGYNVILSDLNTNLRGVSLSYDGGDPYDPQQAKISPL